jgi:hypothetical protein
MQFVVWRNSPKARVLIEFIVTCAFATAVHLMVAELMAEEPTLTENITKYVEMQRVLSTFNTTTSAAYKA